MGQPEGSDHPVLRAGDAAPVSRLRKPAATEVASPQQTRDSSPAHEQSRAASTPNKRQPDPASRDRGEGDLQDRGADDAVESQGDAGPMDAQDEDADSQGGKDGPEEEEEAEEDATEREQREDPMEEDGADKARRRDGSRALKLWAVRRRLPKSRLGKTQTLHEGAGPGGEAEAGVPLADISNSGGVSTPPEDESAGAKDDLQASLEIVGSGTHSDVNPSSKAR